VRTLGLDQGRLRDEGLVFAVRRVVADYLKPARFDDILTVDTQMLAATSARSELRQEVRRDDDLLFTALVTLVCLGPDGRPARLPQALRLMLNSAPD